MSFSRVVLNLEQLVATLDSQERLFFSSFFFGGCLIAINVKCVFIFTGREITTGRNSNGDPDCDQQPQAVINGAILPL